MHQLDYELDEVLHTTTSDQLRASADPTRSAILHLLLDRAATTSELAEAVGRPNGTVAHHLKVLERAGFVKVVRTRQVRAITEKFWGRTARTIWFHTPQDGPAAAADNDPSEGTFFLTRALAEYGAAPSDHEGPGMTTLRHARIAVEDAAEFVRRLEALAIEFTTTPRGGDTVFALLVSLFPTAEPALKEPT